MVKFGCSGRPGSHVRANGRSVIKVASLALAVGVPIWAGTLGVAAETQSAATQAPADEVYTNLLPPVGSMSRDTSDRIYRIVSGSLSHAGSWPSMVAVTLRGQNICGGTVIDSEWVLTAAHCIKKGFAPFDYAIHEGAVNLQAGGRTISAKEMIVHDSPKTNDVALLRLIKPASSPRQVLAGQADMPKLATPGAMATVTGFGRINPRPSTVSASFQAGPSSDHLLQTDVPFVTREKCAARYGESRVTSGQICAGFEEGGRDACQGDSGGPLFARGDLAQPVQVGVVSFGEGCAQPKSYGVYASVGAAENWIRRHVPNARFASGATAKPDQSGTAAIPDPMQTALASVVTLAAANAERPGRLAQINVDLVQGIKVHVNSLIQIRVTSSVSGKLLVFSRDSDGTFYQIFPNRFTRNKDGGQRTDIQAGIPVVLPSPTDTYQLRVAPPLGSSDIYALVLPPYIEISDLAGQYDNLQKIDNAMDYFGKIADRELRSRGIRVEAAPLTDRAVGQRSYLIVK